MVAGMLSCPFEMKSLVNEAISYVLFKIEDLGINGCKGILDSPKHINSQ